MPKFAIPCGHVNQSFDSVPAFQASILFVICDHALTRVTWSSYL